MVSQLELDKSILHIAIESITIQAIDSITIKYGRDLPVYSID